MRPASNEYSDYYSRYIELVSGNDILAAMIEQSPSAFTFWSQIDAARAAEPCEPGKWTIKQILSHLIDTERIFAYRALRFARTDNADLPGFDQDYYVEHAGANQRSWDSLLEEYKSVRFATVTLLRSFSTAAWDGAGTASGSPLSARAAAWIIAGHELHHIRLLRTQLRRER